MLILGIDQFLDMGRMATNVIGNSISTAVVAKWEGELKAPRDTEGEGLIIPAAGSALLESGGSRVTGGT